MLIVDDNIMQLMGVTLPGLFDNIEVKANAQVDEVDIKGKGPKPKQATGYQDSKIYLKLILVPDDTHSILDKMRIIQDVFRRTNQKKPDVLPVVNAHINERGINKVIFKEYSTIENSDKNVAVATLEFWEYVPITVTAKKKSTSKPKPSTEKTEISLDDKYRAYLSSNRGIAPALKTNSTPAIDDASHLAYSYRQSDIPY